MAALLMHSEESAVVAGLKHGKFMLLILVHTLCCLC